jgi:type III secretion system FlhB-like substrate exporter
VFASKKKIELNIRPEVLQAAFDAQLETGIDSAGTIKAYAHRKGIALKMRPDALQTAFENNLTEGFVHRAEEIKSYAFRNKIKIKIRPDVLRTKLQAAFEKGLAEGSADDAEEIATYASKNGIKLKMRPDLLQLGFESALEGMYYRIAEIEKYASKNRIELKMRPDALQLAFEKAAFSYIHVHAGEGEELSEEAKRLLTYSTVHGIKLKTDFKHDPTDLALETKVSGMSIAIYCRKPDSELGGFGKYVIGLDRDANEIKLIFDSRLFTHEMICKAYNLEAWGGGKMTINKERREIGIFGKSQMFGPAPDSVVIMALTTAFPEYKIVKEALPPGSD